MKVFFEDVVNCKWVIPMFVSDSFFLLTLFTCYLP